MSQIIIGPTEDQDAGRPSAMGAVLGLVAVLTLAVMVAIGDAGVDDDGHEAQDLSASTITSTTRPSRIAVPPPEPQPRAADRFVEYSMAELIGGPQLIWQEVALPADLTVAYEVGEHDGRPAVIGSRHPPDDRGEIPGAVLYRMTPDGTWTPPLEVIGDDRYFVAGEVSERGFTVISSGVVGRLDFTDTTVAVHASPEGATWEETPLSDGAAVVVEGIASDDLATWVFGRRRLPAPRPEIEEVLPDEVVALLDDPLVDLVYDGHRVQVVFLGTLVLFQADEQELGLDLPDHDPAEPDPVLWRSTDRSRFVEVPRPLGSLVPIGSPGGSTTNGVYIPAIDRSGPAVAGSIDGSSWDSVLLTGSGGYRSVLGLDGALIGLESSQAPRVEVTDGGARTSIGFDLRDSGDWTGTPAVGRAGYVIPTGRLPVLRPGRERWAVERDGIAVSANGDWSLIVEDERGEVESFSLFGDPPNVDFDPSSGMLSLIGDDERTMARLILSDLADAFTRPAYTPMVATGSVLYTPDGATWSWTPLIGITGTPGLITAAAVGDESVYVIAGDAADGPRDVVSLQPRLFVGTPQR